jgi:hypothetical protein
MSENQTTRYGNQTHGTPHEEEEEEDLEYQAETVMTILKPVSITMIFVIWAVKTVTIPVGSSAG